MPTQPAPTTPDFSAAIPDLPEPVVAAAAPAKSNDGMLEFDLSSLSLDLGPSSPAAGAPEANPGLGDDSLETKLALAEEFVSIGDDDGARALIEEVVAEATGELREKAQRALANLS
jgi:pilus assembly protein FimV